MRRIAKLLALVLCLGLLAGCGVEDILGGMMGPREAQATANGRTILRRRGDTVYAISFSDYYLRWSRAIPKDEVAERFVPIINRWTS